MDSLYGAGDAKIGQIVEGSAREGAILKKKFLSNLPALKILKQR
jgi:DNA polymerase-1